MLKNSGKVKALVLYTGKDTKIFLNSGKHRFKRSKIERNLQFVLLFNVLTLFVLDFIMTGKCAHFIKTHSASYKYIWPEDDVSVGKYAGKTFATYYLLFNTFVPLALSIVLEFAKYAY